MEKPEPSINEEDIKVAGMIEEILRTSVIQKEGLIRNHEIHISVAPIRVPVSEQKERNYQAKKNEAQRPVPCLHIEEMLEASECLHFIPPNPKRHRCLRSKLRFHRSEAITVLRFRRTPSNTPQLPKAKGSWPDRMMSTPILATSV